ncbi:glycosyltransferase [Polynucleobacter sp. MWH-Braz-FAM2G]|uniref:glycosyltransferase family 2 protein n=1 Tax=Polynucleobacter sp. MWH-Braz-FAM2G TaxID=1855883 RepID=UPI001BFDE074|nr:glycosyltransferase [Polynucleobacter sp. MWH-Braz-FAM2G]QWD91096.1 glycosyltransferase [Polynucleobacter sp. MWH-Braz-FAM2G]
MSVESPRISVLLPVYNGASFLAASIESILSQSFEDFELLILNDGSTDDSAAIARTYADERIRYFEHPNMGLAATLNKGAYIARGEFLFRQDQDDLSYPERFALQVAYLDKHPDVAVLGTWARIFVDGDSAVTYRYHRHPTTHVAIAFNSIFDSTFVHSSVAMRRSAFEAIGGYSCDPLRQPPEDFELWSRMCRQYRVANLDKVLIDYREVTSSMSRVLREDFSQRMLRISIENLRFWLDGSPFAMFSERLASIFRLDGLLPTQATDKPMIDLTLNQLGQTIGVSRDVHNWEYIHELQRIRHRLMRNYWLGRSRQIWVRLAVKVVFRVLKGLHG